MTISIGARNKKLPADLRYCCPVCDRMSQYPGPCSFTCRQRATPEQLKPVLVGPPLGWSPEP